MYYPSTNIEPDINSHFTSFDISLIAYLLCVGFELIGMDKSHPRKVRFIVRRDKGLDKAVSDFWSFKTSVDALTYFTHLKNLKNQIYSD